MMRIGDVIVKKPTFGWDFYKFYQIKKQTPKMVYIDHIEAKKDLDYPLTGSARLVITYKGLTNKILGTYRIKINTLYTDYGLYDKSKTYRVVHYDD